MAAMIAPLLAAALLFAAPWGAAAAAAAAEDEDPTSSSIDGCLRKDSISCVQMYVFRRMKSFFDQDSIELFGGLSLVREPAGSDGQARSSSTDGAGKDDAGERTVVESSDVEGRENALESFALDRSSRFFQDRSLKWDLSPVANQVAATARSFAENVPAVVRDKFFELFADDDVEGRGRKKKKLLKKILPILLAVKLKVATLLGLSYLAIALIAKKAILASLISLAISAYIGIRKLLSQQRHGYQPHYEVETYQAHGGGWSPGSSGGGVAYSSGGFSSYGGGGGGGGFSGGYDSSYSGHGEYGSHSSPVAHTLAYSGQKPVRR